MLFLPKKGYLQCRGFMHFDDRFHLPNLPAVYFVLGGEQLLYVGMTTDLKKRFVTHHKLSDFRGAAEYVLWASPENNQSLRQTESELIAAFQPSLNANKPTQVSELAKKIKRAREQKGLTQEKFAELIGVSRQTVWRIEHGAVRATRVHKIATEVALNVSLDDISLSQAA